MPDPTEGEKLPPVEAATLLSDVLASMDPHLQRLVARRRWGVAELPTASTGHDEVAVIAKVTNLSEWEGLSEVRVGGTFGETEDGTLIVTGRIPISRVEHVWRLPFVKSLKAARSLRPVLHMTLEETGARPGLLPSGNLTTGGKGVVIGIIDSGCDFVHQNFRNADGTTRLVSIWHQAGTSGPNSPFSYGKEHTQAQINAALRQADPYQALGYAPPIDRPLAPPGAHGTHVMDIATGNGRGSGEPGVAPQADIIFVDVAPNDIPRVGPDVVGKSFGDSVRLLEAVQYIFQQAGGRPCVVNISLGTNGGPHDGTTLVEDGLDRLVRQAPNRAIVLAASNAFTDGIHATGTVPVGGHVDLVWEVAPNDTTQNELEVWYTGQDRFAVELIFPDGTSLGRVEPGDNRTFTAGNQVAIFLANRVRDPNNGDNMIGVFLERGLPPGRWIVRLHGVTVVDGGFHAWIERDDANPSRFALPHDNSHTIGSISCGQETIVVGSYDAHKVSTPISFFSSAGPTRDGREKPEVSAPGHEVFAAHSRTGTGVVRKSGTSMAAPAVAGIVALMLAEAQARGHALSVTQIRTILIDTARRNPPAGAAWDPRYGYGRVFAAAAVEAAGQ